MENERRKHTRIPPLNATLVLKPKGWFSVFSRNLSVQWLDVSEGGIGVLVSQRLNEGERLRARLAHAAYRDAFDVTVEVMHVRESQTQPGRYVTGLRFLDPSPLMRMCVRSLVDTGRLPQRQLVAAFRRAG